jgi:hypothetical protein
MEMNDVPLALPWWKSRVIVGALVSAVTKVLALSGVTTEIAPEAAWIDLVLILASLAGDFIAIRARVVQVSAPPIVGSKAATIPSD